MTKKILFISHDASRTGAPMLLLTFMKWLKDEHPEYEQYLYLGRGGELYNDFRKLAQKVYLLDTPTNNLLGKVIRKVLRKNSFIEIVNKIKKIKWDLIFSNTIVNGKELSLINADKTIPVISYIHELDYTIDFFDREGRISGTILNTDFYLCGSQCVKENLMKRFKIQEDKLAVIYSFSEIQKIKLNSIINEELRGKLNIPKDDIVIGMMGAFVWRKGYDFFVDVALNCTKNTIHFVWIGIKEGQVEIEKIYYDLKKRNKSPKIYFLEASPDYEKYYNVFDIFFLSSREDPYPLVAVEAASFGLPVICFEKSGGFVEFMDDKTGFVAKYADTISVLSFIDQFHKQDYDSAYISEKSVKVHDVNFNASQIVDIFKTVTK
jgi:glycosyltransferase involved in cell wall biosynthesis